MDKIKLIADSGSTKVEWCLLSGNSALRFVSGGLSPYFLTRSQIETTVREEVLPRCYGAQINDIFFYGTGCKSDKNKEMFQDVFFRVFRAGTIVVNDDLDGASKSLCGHEKGVVCILGTGSGACFFDGHVVTKSSPGLGFILGDEGSGATLGKSLLQHYLYDWMDDDLKKIFETRFSVSRQQILDHVYRKPLANKYLASYTVFLSENRGNYLIENILADEFDKFFYTHIIRFAESELFPVNFTGSVSYFFRDIISSLCENYGFKTGRIEKAPMDGLIRYHSNQT